MTCWSILLHFLCAVAPLALAAPDDGQTIAATVDDSPIYVADIDRELARAVGDRPVEPETRAALRRDTLRQLIDRQLVLRYLQRSEDGASQAEVDRAVQRLRKLAEQQEVAWDVYLERIGTDETRLRYQLAWEIGWTRFLEKQATDENLQRYFEQHRRDFDGSQVRAAHILLRIESPQDSAQVAAAVERAEQIRKQIVDGQLTFAGAAQQFSDAPTAAEGGGIGLIGRRGPMPEAFSAAAFALDAGQVSEPVVSPFGVHVIQSLEIVPGNRTWKEARDELHEAVTHFLFRWAADRQRAQATIKIDEAFQ